MIEPADGRVSLYAKQLGYFCVVFVLSCICVKIVIEYFLSDGPAIIWPASGIGLGFLLISHRKYWWPIGIAIVVSPMVLDLLDGHSPLTAACFGLAAAGESFLAALLVTKCIRKRITLMTFREVIALIFIAALFSNALTALLGVGANALMGRTNYFEVWYRWAIADGAGMLLVTPLVVALSGLRIRNVKFNMKAFECVAVLCVFAYFCVYVFRTQSNAHHALFVFSCMLTAFLVYAGIRHRTLGAAAYNTVLFCVSIYFTCSGIGPFSHGTTDLNASVLTLQGFLFVGGSISYLIAAALNEKDLAIQEVEEHRARQVELQERLARSEKLEAIGQLAAGVAHDFNNQLGGIMNFADLLLSKSKDEELHRYIEAIIRSCTRGKVLTGQLLAFSRKGKYEVVPVNIHRTIAEVVAMLEHSIDKRIRIRQLLEANPSTTTGDPTQLQNALLNLGLNARDAMPKGGELVFTTDTVTLDEEHCNKSMFSIAPGDYLKVTVADSGTGMDEATLARVFEPFFTTKDEGKGTGMGMASVYGTAINHHGAIEVDTEVGKGTTMTVCLPLSKKETQETQATVKAVAAKSGEARILLVDDEKCVRESTALLLRGKGYKVVTCEDGAEAVEYYKKSWQHIDLVILDMNMPVLNGRDTLIAMREMNPEVQAILATGYSLDNSLQEILDEVTLSHIQKPYCVDDLVLQIEQALLTDC